MKLSTCTEWLFFHLWKKNPQSGQSCHGVFLADTVIYRWAQPYFRYFTAPNGQIIRKTKERVYIEQVEETFNCQKQEVVGVLMTSAQQTNLQDNRGQIGQQKRLQENILFEYFEKQGFSHFLHQREKDLNAILQKFVTPKGGRNSMIKVSWSPQFCLLHRKTNKYSIEDGKKSIYERVSTFEGPEYLADSDSISSPLLSADLEQLCVNIVKHIQEVSGGNIQIIRMVLYFKIDEENRIWLLFCTGIKVRDKFSSVPSDEVQQIRLDSPVFRVVCKDEEQIRSSLDPVQKQIKISDGVIEKLKYQSKDICSNCDNFSRDQYLLQFGHIIKAFATGVVSNSFTKLPEELDKIRSKNAQQHQQLQKSPKTQKFASNTKFEIENQIDQQTKNLLTTKYLSQGSDKGGAFVNFQEEIKELCRQLDEEQEDQKYNFIDVPALIIKVWGKIPEERYQLLKTNPSWRSIKTQVCLDCFLKFTQILESTKLTRQISTAKELLKEKLKAKSGQPLIIDKNKNNGKNKSQALPNLDSQQSSQKHIFKIALPKNQTMQHIIDKPVTPYVSQIPSTQQEIVNVNPALEGKVQKRQVKTRTEKIYNNCKNLKIPLTPAMLKRPGGYSTSELSTQHSGQHVSIDFQLNTIQQLKSRLLELDDI